MERYIARCCLFGLLITGIFHRIYAQSENFKTGIFLNGNGIHVVGDDEIFWQSSKGKILGGGGLSGGIFVKSCFSTRYYMAFEIRYIQKGSIYEYLNEYGTQSFEVLRLNYMEVPVLAGFHFNKNKRDLYLETGMGFARLFSSKVKINELIDRNENQKVKNFKNMDISWIGSLKFPINQKGKKNLLFGLRYSYSIFSIHDNFNLRNMVYGIQFDYIINN